MKSEKIWEIQKKRKLNSEMKSKFNNEMIWKKGKSNSGKIWTNWKKGKSNSEKI